MLRLLCVLALVLPRVVLAKCAAEALSVWPSPSQPLPANGQIVLEGFGRLQESVASLSRSAPRLVAEKDEVPLHVLAVYPGQREVTQAVLRPERPLRPGLRYTLRLTPPEDSKLRPLPTEVWSGERYTPIAWTVSSEDVSPPRWRQAPVRISESVERMGCGPEVFVHVSAGVEDEGSQVQVLAELRNVSGGEPVRFRVTPSEGQVALGHGMCGGPFQFEEGQHYTARLIAVDMAGNETPAPGDAVPFEGPKGARGLTPTPSKGVLEAIESMLKSNPKPRGMKLGQ